MLVGIVNVVSPDNPALFCFKINSLFELLYALISKSSTALIAAAIVEAYCELFA